MASQPIAIVGQACLLPGASSPEALWQLVLAGRVATRRVAAERWGIDPVRMLPAPGAAGLADKAVSDVGGYVEGFASLWDPKGFAVAAAELDGLDPLFHWLLHVGREALRDAGWWSAPARSRARVGAVVGNLSYPSTALSRLGEATWIDGALGAERGAAVRTRLGIPTVDARNRFMSGLPAHLLGRALDLGGTTLALDAACASALYAVKLACDALRDGTADLMLAGAVNRADDLFLHAGFTALGALSPSGRSRPFHAGADGLVPGEGAAMLALRRLDDARRDGDPILAVIRGVGVANDGRGRGLLVPFEDGQVRALQAAYADAGLTPADVSLVECHATGTTVGDAVEIGTLRRVFGPSARGLAVGSLKANLGHTITVAGAAGLIKVVGALRSATLPPMPAIDEPTAALREAGLRLVRDAEPWPAPPGGAPRRAAVSAFGFGGNDAHVIVEEAPPAVAASTRVSVPAVAASTRVSVPVAPASPLASAPPTPASALAVVALAVRAGAGQSTADFADTLLGNGSGGPDPRRADRVTLSLQGLRFPPKDLDETLPQQLLLLAAARDALDGTPGLGALPRERTGVFVGMQCDAEIARHGARWRAAEWAHTLDDGSAHGAAGNDRRDAWLATARDGFIARLGAAGVVGAMPNVPANRLSSQWDLGGPAFTVSAEELSGVRALEIAARALRAGDIDAAVVGAVDLCAEPVHEAAARAILPGSRQRGGDAAVVLVVRRLDDARAEGQTVLGVLDPPTAATDAGDVLHLGDEAGDGAGAVQLAERFGHAHAASGLLHVAAAIVCCGHGRRPAGPGGTDAPPAPRTAVVAVDALGGQSARVRVGAGDDGAVAILQRRPVLSPPLWSLPAHAATPTFALPPVAVAAGRFVMPPAPPLPSVWTEVPPVVWGPSVPIAATAPALPPGLAGVLAERAAYLDGVARLHQAHLASQTALHQQFLGGRQQATATLLGAALAVRGSVARPTAPRAIPSVSPPRPAPGQPHGPVFTRRDLEIHASGRISTLFGPAFAGQDAHAVQVRMPEPPLLLADRVVGLDAQPGSMGTGTVWTETDVATDSWYLNRGFMPAGVMIEAGQADLFLISYLGVDAYNRGERAYRLLGCELTYHGSLPRPGETLRYAITIDGHARQGDTRLFFFHYDCTIGDRPALTVRAGQAGFFSKEELDGSAGVLWRPEEQAIRPLARVDAPAVRCTRRSFDEAQVRAFADGDGFACFGEGFEWAQTHVRSPAIQNDRMRLIDRVTDFDPAGGPWGRGYLRASTTIHPGDWFFAGHFKNDPCMPGTLMFEGCLQAMAFYLAGLGYTLGRDGWRFAPVPEEAFKLQCRGQVLPTSRELVCELFVEEVHDGRNADGSQGYPTLYADLLGTVDGLPAFHARRVGLRLEPDWPLSDRPGLVAEARAADRERDIATVDGFRFDHASLLACAWGRPSDAFGPMYQVFDGTRKVARLPGPPYHFMSRVTRVDGAIGVCQPGATLTIAYDVPRAAWYFDGNGQPTMPYAVLLETVLQPCGWLASYVGSALLGSQDLAFRNLDGNGRVMAEIPPDIGTLHTEVKLTGVSRSGGMILETFDVRCLAGDTLVYQLSTGFGFFPPEALANQVGLPTSDEERARALGPARPDGGANEPGPTGFVLDAEARAGAPELAGDMLFMLDRVMAFDADGGRAGLGFARAEKDVDPAEWFFKAHFFQDPVQPGSLGLEAMLQLLQVFMRQTGMAHGMARPRFQSIATGRDMVWKYRGQVTPRNRVITTTLDVSERGRDDLGVYAIADASLWVDGKRIYEARGLAMRIVDDDAGRVTSPADRASPSAAASTTVAASPAVPASHAAPASHDGRRVLGPEACVALARAAWPRWLGGHAPVVEDIDRALVARFVRAFRIEAPDLLEAAVAAGRGVLFLGNHQTAIESTLFAIVASALVGGPIVTLAKIENREHWLERLMQHTFAFPGLRRPETTLAFDRSDPAALPRITRTMAEAMGGHGRSVMVHVDGTRALSAREPARKLSGLFVELALEVGCPIVPVRFSGGLPIEPLAPSRRAELPWAMGRQDIDLGRAITAAELQPLNYRERRERVLLAIEATGPEREAELPLPGDPDLEASVAAWARERDTHLGHATVWRLLEALPDPSPDTVRLVAAVRARTGARLGDDGTALGAWLAELARRLGG